MKACAADDERKEESCEAMKVDAEGSKPASSKKRTIVKEPNVFTFYDTCSRDAGTGICSGVMHPAQRLAGVIMLRDTTPDEAEDVEAGKAPAPAGAGNEAGPPEPFEWESPQ
ncbi:hypothetical protein PsorP6_018608 [Peronosclerospora sorghi]|nr:hypothetical protein PsorP6_018608 [Peronosclerospora sorghi]